MKETSDPDRGRVRDTRSRLEPRELWVLVALYALAHSSALLLWSPGPTWAAWLGRAGVATFVGLVGWWGITHFSGYEHRAGLRILRRPGGPTSSRGLLISMAVVVVGMAALLLGWRTAPLVIATAVAALVAVILALVRRFAVFASIAIVGIVIGVAALIVVQSVATGFQHEFERRVLGVYAHINVTRSDGIAEYRRFEAYLRTLEGVRGASPFVYYAMALAPERPRSAEQEQVRQASVLVKGIEPSTADQVIDLTAHLAAGGGPPVGIDALSSDLKLQPVPDRPDDELPAVVAQFPDPRGPNWYPKALAAWSEVPESRKYGHGRQPAWLGDADEDPWPDAAAVVAAPAAADLPTMFVGVTLARELELSVGDVVTLVDPKAGFVQAQAPEFRRYRVAGVFRAGFQEYDTRLVYVHIKELQWFKYSGKDKVSGVDLRLDDPYEAPAIDRLLGRTIGSDEYSILEWQRLNASLFQSIRTHRSVLTVLLSLVSAVAGFNVLAALWAMVVRRYAEIAILMSMGSTESGAARVFQFAGMTLGAVGAVAGVAFGLFLCWLVELYGYTLDPDVYFIERLPVEVSPGQIAAVLVLTMGISFLATIPPCLRAAKLRPVEGLRYE